MGACANTSYCSSLDFATQSSHSVDLAGWQAKMASIEVWAQALVIFRKPTSGNPKYMHQVEPRVHKNFLCTLDTTVQHRVHIVDLPKQYQSFIKNVDRSHVKSSEQEFFNFKNLKN